MLLTKNYLCICFSFLSIKKFVKTCDEHILGLVRVGIVNGYGGNAVCQFRHFIPNFVGRTIFWQARDPKFTIVNRWYDADKFSRANFKIVQFFKGQLISKCPFGIFKLHKNQQFILRISALESKKWSNQHNKGLFLYTMIYIYLFI